MLTSKGTLVPWLFTACGALLAACSGASVQPRSCSTSDQCSATARCVSSACVSNAAPVAAIAAPSSNAAAFGLVTLDGSSSYEPDAPNDGIVTYAWTIESITAPCDPPLIASSTSRPQVRFACAGQYTVRLVVTDQLSAASAPATRTIVVAPGASAITAGADVSRDHACSGSPALCTVSGGAIALSASAAGPLGDDVSYRWEVEPPPGLTLDDQRRVTFDPGPDSLSPNVSIETDGTAISGDWIFWIELRDASGVLGRAAQRVSVGNRPPAVVAVVPGLPHAYDPVGMQFTASGKIALSVTDPDGDPLTGRTVSWHHTGDGAGTFGGQDLPDGITGTVSVPYGQPSDAAHLIGPDVARTVSFSVQDVNGAIVRQDWPVQILNRPPVLVSSPASVSVDHSFDGTKYLAGAQLGTWSDPDGDPLTQDGATGDAICSDLSFTNTSLTDRVAVLRCSVPYTGVPAAGAIAGSRLIVQRPRDGWDIAAASVSTTVQVKNRLPRLTKTSAGPSSLGQWGTCCRSSAVGDWCAANWFTADAASFSVSSFVADDDGDPIQLEVTPNLDRIVVTPRQQTCIPGACALWVDDPGQARTCADVFVWAHFTAVLRDGGPDVSSQLTYGSLLAWDDGL